MIKVWTLPVSLAATKGISIDFYSSGYLDVSVRQVTFPTLCIQIRMYRYKPIRVAPFGNLRVKACSSSPKLIAAFHVLHQPVCQGILHMPFLSCPKRLMSNNSRVNTLLRKLETLIVKTLSISKNIAPLSARIKNIKFPTICQTSFFG